MAKKNNTWGTVCDDGFEEIDAQAACHTLGFNGFIGFQVAYDSGPVLGFSKPEIPFVLYKVECSSKTANFLDCKHGKDNVSCDCCGGGHNCCTHVEDILLTCE